MDVFEEYKNLNKRKCSKIIAGGFKPTNSKDATNFAIAPLGFVNEEWPYNNGRPLVFICLTDAPYVSELVKDIALLTFYIDLDSYFKEDKNKNSWVYSHL